MATRNALRAATLSPKVKFKKENIKTGGTEYEVRQPSYKTRQDIIEKCTVDDKFNMAEFIVWAVIYNTYIPGTDELVFEEEDYNTFMNLPTGGPLDDLGEVALKLHNVSGDTEKK